MRECTEKAQSYTDNELNIVLHYNLQSYALRIVRRENQALISQGELLRLSLYQKQREMEKAVEKQDFERAALLRDEIRAMQEKEKNHGTDL